MEIKPLPPRQPTPAIQHRRTSATQMAIPLRCATPGPYLGWVAVAGWVGLRAVKAVRQESVE